jgi:hypothetical protein
MAATLGAEAPGGLGVTVAVAFGEMFVPGDGVVDVLEDLKKLVKDVKVREITASPFFFRVVPLDARDAMAAATEGA